MRTLYAFHAVSLIGGTIYGLYYGVFLYKHTFSLTVLAFDGLIGGLGVWLGYLAGVILIKQRGYNQCIRGAFLLWALISFATAFLTHHIAAIFMLIALVKAIPGGMYAAVGDTIMLRDISTRSRNGFFQLHLALEFFASILLPSAVGALISMTASYQWAFVIAGAVYSASFLLKSQLPKPRVALYVRGIPKIIRRPLYPYHAVNRTVAAGFNQLNAFAIAIVPFLILQDEMSMGIIASASALIAAVVSLAMRKLKNAKHQLRLGYGAYVIRTVMSSMFVTAWTTPLLAAWQLTGKVLTPLHDPLQQSMDIHNDSLILGKSAADEALMINVLNNTLKLIGTSLAFGGFILLVHIQPVHQRSILSALIVAYALWRIVALAVSAAINRTAQSPKPAFTPRLYAAHMYSRLHFLMRHYALRIQLLLAQR